MPTHSIPRQTRSFYGMASFSIEGTVDAQYPKASASVKASATGCSDHVYKVSLDPEAGRWESSDTHGWTMLNKPVTLRLRIDRQDMKTVHADVYGKTPGDTFWSDSYDIYDPYQPRRVQAWAQGAFGPGIEEHADHTYGVGFSDAGQRSYLWPCGGDHDGKNAHSIAQGEAFEPECDCLSQRLADPVTKGLAGIVYGVDGVCHQATNRILCTAGLEVNGARGYKKAGSGQSWRYLSFFLYGRLGVKREGGLKTWEKIKRGCLCRTYARCSETTAEHLLVGTELGISDDQSHAIEAAAAAARAHFIDRYGQLASGAISPTEYADALNGRVAAFLAEARQALGDQRHRTVFGDLPAQGLVLVEPSICESVFGNGAPALASP